MCSAGFFQPRRREVPPRPLCREHAKAWAGEGPPGAQSCWRGPLVLSPAFRPLLTAPHPRGPHSHSGHPHASWRKVGGRAARRLLREARTSFPGRRAWKDGEAGFKAGPPGTSALGARGQLWGIVLEGAGREGRQRVEESGLSVPPPSLPLSFSFCLSSCLFLSLPPLPPANPWLKRSHLTS